MPVTKFQTLSKSKYFPFNTALEDFFENYEIFEDVECYQLFFSPYPNCSVEAPDEGTSFDDLHKLKFKSSVVIFNVMDSIINKDETLALDSLKEFVSMYPEQKFIFFNNLINLNKLVNNTNFYSDFLLSFTLPNKYIHCEKHDIKKNRWVMLSANYRPFRVLTASYMISKKLHKHGYMAFNDDECNEYIINFKNYPEELFEGFKKLKNKKFNQLSIKKYNHNNFIDPVSNYHLHLLPVYKKIALEIVLGTHFDQPLPLISEKEIQSIYGKNFSIYMNSAGVVDELKNYFGIDVFDDIINHSYDKIKDPFKRIKTAIDENKALLNGSTNLNELWNDNKSRFIENCNRLDSLIFDKTYQNYHNEKSIKKALDHFKILYKRR